MVYAGLKKLLTRFRDDERGTIMIETVIALPLLVWALAASYEFFEVHRYMSVRDKASFTIADMVSRETEAITPVYLDNAKQLYDEITNDTGSNDLRVSVVRYDEQTDSYFIRWSQVRGQGSFTPLQTADVAQAHDILPIMDDGEDLVLVESRSTYAPLFNVGLADNLQIETRIFVAPRFTPQVIFDDGTT